VLNSKPYFLLHNITGIQYANKEMFGFYFAPYTVIYSHSETNIWRLLNI